MTAPMTPPAASRPCTAAPELVEVEALEDFVAVSVDSAAVVPDSAADVVSEAADLAVAVSSLADLVALPDSVAAVLLSATLLLAALALEAALELALALALALLVDSLQVTESGTVTPAVEQICWAYLTAAAWPSASHLSLRQQAMPFRKSPLLQMHLMSSWPHPAMPLPVVYLLIQDVYPHNSN